MKYALAIITLILSFTSGQSQPLDISKDKHYLIDKSGTHFFWLADTAWELFQKLNLEESEKYLSTRQEQGFNVIQAAILYENAIDYPINQELISDHILNGLNSDTNNAIQSDFNYWNHVEKIIRQAIAKEMKIALLPCWDEYVATNLTQEHFLNNPRTAYDYGFLVGSRLKKYKDHIIWMIGGDRLPEEHNSTIPIWQALAEGITDAISDKPLFDNSADYQKTFMTFHLNNTVEEWARNEEWIDMIIWGSYQNKRNDGSAYQLAMVNYEQKLTKPTLNSEACFELMPIGYDWESYEQGYFDEIDVRKAAYWSIFSGACGHTYGCHPIWQMYNANDAVSPMTKANLKIWSDALYEPGAQQMGILKSLFSRFYPEAFSPLNIINQVSNDPKTHQCALSSNKTCLVYTPYGLMVQILMDKIPFEATKAYWFNPRNGDKIKEKSFNNRLLVLLLTPPGSLDRNNDWVLIIQ